MDGISYKVVGIRKATLGVITISLDTDEEVCKLSGDTVEVEYSHNVNQLLDDFEAMFAGNGLRL